MWKIVASKNYDKPIIRYTIKTIIYHLGIVPVDKDLYIYIDVIPNTFCGPFIVFSKEIDQRGISEGIQSDVTILESIAEALTLRYESKIASDELGRVSFNSLSDDNKARFDSAFVDEFVDNLRLQLVNLLTNNSILYKDSTPWDKKTIVLSHDVDDLYGKSLIRYIFWLLKGITSIKTQIKKIKWWRDQRSDPYFSPLEMCRMEGVHGFRSTFYFMAKTSYLTLDEGRRYNVKSKQVRKLMSEVKRLGWEVGFHPSRITSNSFERLNTELNNLEPRRNDIKGMRRHYLKGRYPKVWQDIEKLGIKYDTSVGWPDRHGCRSGTSRPYRVFDYEKNRELDVYEMPLTFMDGTLKYKSHEQYLNDYFKIEESLLPSGCMTFLWHTDRLCDEIDSPTWATIYKEILESWAKKGYRVITTLEYIELYIQHENKFDIKFESDAEDY